MWMPSTQPLGDASAEHVTLDWETIGRAIRECVLDAIEMHAAQDLALKDDIELGQHRKRAIDVE